MRAAVGLRVRLVLAGLVAFSVGMLGGVPASAVAEDRLLPPTATPAGTFEDVPYVRYDGIFEGETSTGAFGCRTASLHRWIPRSETARSLSSRRTASRRAWRAQPLSATGPALHARIRPCGDRVEYRVVRTWGRHEDP